MCRDYWRIVEYMLSYLILLIIGGHGSDKIGLLWNQLPDTSVTLEWNGRAEPVQEMRIYKISTVL